VSSSSGRLGQLFLRYATPLYGLRNYPLIGPIVSWAGAKLVPRDSLTWAQISRGPAEGLWLHLNPRTGRNYFEGGGEPEVQAALQRHLRAGMTFYDIGANIGFFSLLAARIVGKDGHVVAFEADPEVANRLRENIERNRFPGIIVEEKAVCEKSGPVFFERTDPATSPDRGLGHIVDQPREGTIQRDGITLDDFVPTSFAPDFLKCDVEGAESKVFRGAQKLLAEKRPGILCELHSDENRRFVLEEFSRFRYACKTLDENHVLALPE
jgi:FkbM family methyltransferase